MKFYFSLAQIPELSGLSTRQRELVDALCLQPIRMRTRLRLAKCAFFVPLFVLVAEVIPALGSGLYQKIACYALAMLVLYSADLFFDMVVASLNRKSIAAFVLSHEKELQ